MINKNVFTFDKLIGTKRCVPYTNYSAPVRKGIVLDGRTEKDYELDLDYYPSHETKDQNCKWLRYILTGRPLKVPRSTNENDELNLDPMNEMLNNHKIMIPNKNIIIIDYLIWIRFRIKYILMCLSAVKLKIYLEVWNIYLSYNYYNIRLFVSSFKVCDLHI